MKAVYGKYIKGAAVVWAVSFIVLFVFYLLVLGPQEKLKARTEAKYVETGDLAEDARQAAKEENKTLLDEQVANLKKRLDDFVAVQESMSEFTFIVTNLSRDMNLSSVPISTSPAEGAVPIENCKFLSARNLNVDFTSSFNNFAIFVNALESGDKAQNSRPVIFVDSFDITRSTEGQANNKVNMKLAVLVPKQAAGKRS